MTLFLYECLRAVGLQHHYARFTSVGVGHAAHLSELTMEDYPLLGIRSMEDRTRLFHLVQLVKTLDLENLGYDDGNYNVDGDDEDTPVVESSFSHDGFGNPDEDVSGDENAIGGAEHRGSTTRPSCVQRLDFSDKATNHQQKLFSCPGGTVHVCAHHNRNTELVQEKVPHLDDGSNGACSFKRNNNYTPDVHNHPSYHQKGENIKPNVTGSSSTYNSNTRFPQCVQFHKDSGETFECMFKPTPVYEAKKQAGYNYGLPLSSPPAANKKQEGEQRISVCVRKRPLTRAESRKGEDDVVTTPGGECVIVHESKEAVDLTQYILQHRFYFDHVFGEESSNEEVYQRTAYPLVQHMLNGGKATCFAYGQTGAGKTHTMLGSSPGRPGLYALAVRDIFAHLSTTHAYSSLQVFVSFFEIYCGQLYDLLDHRKRLFAREDGQKVVHISGLRDVRVDSVNSLLEVISHGTEERTQGMSGVNPLSSRSHALLQIQLRDQNQRITGRMWFVDLAGSERASDTKEPDKQSRMEGAEINQSLLALKECIRSLDREESHTPFRQSKLTQVLKDSFVGDSMTCMIANISPGHTATEHTLNTLRYADRVKELRGHGGLRGRRKGKTVPKHDLSHSNSNSSSSSVGSVGIRGKSPSKKPKLGKQSEAFGSTTPNTKSPVAGAILCSTPKNGRYGEETNAKGRRGIGLEHTTPVSGWLGMGVEKPRSVGAHVRDGKKTENEIHTGSGPSVRLQNAKPELMLGQSVGKQLSLWEVQRECALSREGNVSFTKTESGFCHKGKESPQCTSNRGTGEQRKWMELRQVEHIRDSNGDAERQSRRELQKADKKHEERERHLRRYHEQLQQFMPSSGPSSVYLLSPSTHLPFFASSLPSSASPSSLQNSSHLSVSAQMYQGLDEVLDAYKAKAEVRVDGNRQQYVPISNVDTLGEESRFGYDGGQSETGRPMEAAGEVRVRREDWRPGGIEGGERRRKKKWAWGTTADREPGNRMTGAIPTNVETWLSYSWDSEDRRDVGVEGLDASDVTADNVRSTEQGIAAGSTNDSSHLFRHPPFESPHQQAPAERPLSPAWEHTTTIQNRDELTNVKSKHTKYNQNIRPPNSHKENEEFASVASRRKYSESLKHPAEHNSSHDTVSLSYTMEPLSISLLQVDQQPATVSFLQGHHYNTITSLCQFEVETEENSRREGGQDCLLCEEMLGKDVVAEDAEFRLSLLQLPEVKTHHCPALEGTKDIKIHIGRNKSHIPDVVLQDQEKSQKPLNTSPGSSLKPPIRASMQTSDMSPSERHLGNMDLHKLISNDTQVPVEYTLNQQKKASSIATLQSESISSQNYTVDLNHSSNISVQPNKTSDQGNQQIRPTIALYTLDDLDYAKWCVVEAQLKQLKEMEALCRTEGKLLCQQPDMKFGDYVHKLEEIMEKKARCVRSVRAQLQPYLKPSLSTNPQGEDNHDSVN